VAPDKAVIAAVQRYLNAWIAADFPKMYNCFSQHSQAAVPKVKFLKRAPEARRRFERPLRARAIRVLRIDEKSGVADVEYILETQITEERAAQLRKLGHQEAKAGLRVVTNVRRFVREPEGWKIDIPVRSSRR